MRETQPSRINEGNGKGILLLLVKDTSVWGLTLTRQNAYKLKAFCVYFTTVNYLEDMFSFNFALMIVIEYVYL